MTFLLILIVSLTNVTEAIEYRYWQPNLSFEGRLADDSNTVRGGIIYPFTQQEDSLFYGDLRTMFKSEDISEYNLGIGYRKLMKERNAIIGTYLFKDFRKEYGLDWNQWTLGGEYLSDKVDLRLNYYIPAKDKILASSSIYDEIVIAGNNVVYQTSALNEYYEPLTGYDLEIGKRFYLKNNYNIGVYYRYFNFSPDDGNSMQGSGLKIDSTFDMKNDMEWTVGLDWQNDNIRESNLEATIGISIPLGSSSSSKQPIENSLKNRMTEPAKRDIDIIVDSTSKKEVLEESSAVDPVTGNPITNAIFVTANGTGSGTRENPTNVYDLHTIVEGGTSFAEENDVIIFLGDDGVINIGDYSDTFPSLQLLDGQKLLSPGGELELASADDPEKVAYLRPTGKKATLTNVNPLVSDRVNVINTANNITISGLKFEGADYFIRGNHLAPKSNLNINNNIFSVMEDRSVYLNDHTNIDITNNEFLDDTGEIELLYDKEGDFNVNVSDNTFGDMPGEAMYISASSSTNNNINITNNYIESGTQNLITVRTAASNESNVNISGNTIENSTVYGIYVNTLTYDAIKSGVLNLDITDNHLGNVKNRGINVNYYAYDSSLETAYSPFDSSVINIEGNTIDNLVTTSTYASSAIYLDGNLLDSTVTIEKNNIKYSDEYAIHLDITPLSTPISAESYNDFHINNNLIEEVTGLGIYVKSDDEDNNIENVTEIMDNTINKVNPFGSLADAIYVDNKYFVNQTGITGNNIVSTDGRGIYVKGGAINDSFIIVAENEIESSGDNGIEVEFTKPLVENFYKVAIADNIIGYSGGNGVYIAPNYLSFDNENRAHIIIDGNEINESYSNSIEVKSQYNSNYLLEISNNIIGSTTQTGIYLLSDVNNSHGETTYYSSDIDVDLENNNIVSADNAGIEMVATNYEELYGNIDYNLINNIFGQSVDPHVIYPAVDPR